MGCLLERKFMIILCSLQDIAKHKAMCDQVCTCTVWPPKNSTMENVGLFVPTQELVGGHKNWVAKGSEHRWRAYAPVSDEQYTAIYERLLDSRLNDIDHWCSEQHDRTVALCCFCAFTAPFCHLDALEGWFWKRFRKSVRVERKH